MGLEMVPGDVSECEKKDAEKKAFVRVCPLHRIKVQEQHSTAVRVQCVIESP